MQKGRLCVDDSLAWMLLAPPHLLTIFLAASADSLDTTIVLERRRLPPPAPSLAALAALGRGLGAPILGSHQLPVSCNLRVGDPDDSEGAIGVPR